MFNAVQLIRSYLCNLSANKIILEGRRLIFHIRHAFHQLVVKFQNHSFSQIHK